MATLHEVAQKAGVSITTASVVLNRGKQFERISDACVQRVRAAAEGLGYVPNYQARSVRTGRSGVVGMVLELSAKQGGSDTHPRRRASHYTDAMMAGMEAAMMAREYMVLRIRPSRDRTAVQRGIRSIRGKRVDGLLIPGAFSGLSATHVLDEAPDLPIVVVEPREPTELPFVRFDHSEGVRQIVHHLTEGGHRRLLWLGADVSGRHRLHDRESDALDFARSAGASMDICRMPDKRFDADHLGENQTAAAEAALGTYLDQGQRTFTAVVAYNDAVAIGAVRALSHRGIRVPQDVSVTGYDDNQAAFCLPALTTIDHRLFDLGLEAGEWMLRLLDGGAEARRSQRGQQVMVPPRLVVRESTGPAPD